MEKLAFMQPNTASSSSGHETKHSSLSTRGSSRGVASLGAIAAAAPQADERPSPVHSLRQSGAPYKEDSGSSKTGGKRRASPAPQENDTGASRQVRRRSSRSSTIASSSALEAAIAGAQTGVLRDSSRSRAGPRRSAASDASSTVSFRANSPLSTPATPATSISASTSTSATSSQADKGAAHDWSDGKAKRSGEVSRGKRKELEQPSHASVKQNTSPSTLRSSKKSRAPEPLQSEDTVARSKQYPLRLRVPKMPPKKQSVNAGSDKSPNLNRSKGQSRRSKAERDMSGTSSVAGASTSCAENGDMRYDAVAENEEIGVDKAHDEQTKQLDSEEEMTQGDIPSKQTGIDDEDALDHDDEEIEDEDENYEDELDDPYEDEGGGSGGFGHHIRAMAGYVSGLSGRFRTLLSSLRNRKDPTSQMVALQELSEVLSISNEDTLAGYFPTESFVAELVFLMGGPKPKPPKVLGDPPKAKDEEMDDEDDEEVAFLTGAVDNTEMMLLACRCLANLIEAMPYAAHSVVSHGAVPVLNAKLVEIEFIDLAEQVLQTLEKISREYPSAIVNNGGLAAMLQYLDFFNIHVQRTALNAAAHCCRKLSPEAFDKVKDVIGIIQNVLSYSDQRLVESACRCIVRIIDSYRHHTDLLEQLLTSDVVAAVNHILLPSSQLNDAGATSKTHVGPATYAEVLKSLGIAARASPILAVTLLENNIVETLYHLLTGSPAPAEDGRGGQGPAVKSNSEQLQGSIEDNAGAAVAVVNKDGSDSIAMADVAVLQNLAQRPKEQVQEALSLVAELLPPLPRSGVFDPRHYNERAFSKRKAKLAKQTKDADRVQEQREGSVDAQQPDEAIEKPADHPAVPASPARAERLRSDRELAKERAQAKRTETLQQRQELVKRFTQLVLPTLVEVYAASVAWHVRSKALFGILKIVSFVEAEPLCQTLDTVPLASFVAGILSSRDHPMLVQGALQLVELLVIKLPDVYSALLRREGVMWEVEDIASRKTQSSEARKEISPKKTSVSQFEAVKDEESPTIQEVRHTSASGASTSSGAAVGISNGLAPSAALHRHAPISNTTITTMSGHQMSPAEAEDSNIWRARILCDKLAPSASDASAGGADEACRALGEIKQHVESLQAKEGLDEGKARGTLQQIAELFSRTENPISSFELLRSGLVDGLYNFSIQESASLPNVQRRKILIDTLMGSTGSSSKTSPAEVLVRRLQETLSRLENVDITTALSAGDEGSGRRSAAANVARQVRLKLVADQAQDGEIPRSCTNVVVSIHAITSFQSLHDYLRPKISASQALSGASLSMSAPGSTSNLSGMLAAFASNAGLDIPDALRQKWVAAAGQQKSEAEASTKEQPTSLDKDLLQTAIATTSKAEDSSQIATEKPTRRRSSRLSAKGENPNSKRESKPTAAAEESGETSKAKADSQPAKASRTQNDLVGDLAYQADKSREDGKSDEALARQLMEGLLQGQMEGFEDEEGYSDEYDEDFVDDEGLAAMEGGISTGDQTIQLKIDKDGNAKSSDSALDGAPSTLSRSAPAPSANMSPKPPATPTGSGSYASALQKKPVDWHLAFEMDGKPLSLDSTIYSAIHRHELMVHPPVNGQPHPSSRFVWSNTYTIKYRKVSGPAPAVEQARQSIVKAPPHGKGVELPSSLSEHKGWVQILQLLRVLYDLNVERKGTLESPASGSMLALSEATFVNNKITAKLNRQLEEPMILASNCLPPWALDIPKVFPFLFPFETRYTFLQSTSFGYNRLINKWQMQQSRNQDGAGSGSHSGRHDDSFAFLGRLTRQKVRISRNNILASAFKVFELYGGNSSLLEVEYFDEVGTGLGPTLEFYAMVSKEFAKKALNLWRTDEAHDSNEYVYAPNGLFPLPMSQSEEGTTTGKTRLRAFKTLGQFVAKALYDSRIVDLNFSTSFMRAVMQHSLPASMAVLRSVDSALAQSLNKLKAMSADEIESLSLDFTLPGHGNYELHTGGANEAVDAGNVDRYIEEVMEHTLSCGIAAQITAFREGFDLIFPISAMSPFTPDEMALLFGNQEEDWSEPTLLSTVKPDHGYTGDSTTFRDVIALMSQFDATERRDFLQWLTGSPKLPIGGFTGLHPQLTIVKRPPDSNISADHTLPSVMTCVNFCKMPPFSSRAVMKERLLFAMREGQASFHLS